MEKERDGFRTRSPKSLDKAMELAQKSVARLEELYKKFPSEDLRLAIDDMKKVMTELPPPVQPAPVQAAPVQTARVQTARVEQKS